MPHLVRVGEEIYGSGKTFTPEWLQPAWDGTMNIIEPLLGLGSGFDPALWGYGRLAGTDYNSTDAGAITVPVPAALAIRINPATYYANDADGNLRTVIIEEAIDLPVPANLSADYVYLRAVEIPDSEGVYTVEVKETSGTAIPANITDGYPSVGIVTSDADAVTEIDKSSATVIYTGPLVQQLLLALLAATGGDGGGEGSGDVTQLSQLIYNITHPIPADQYIDEQLASIREQLIEIQGGPKKFPDDLSLLADALSGVSAGLFEVNPPAMLRVQMSALGRGFGKGQNSTPDVSPDTGEANEATYDYATGLITP